MTFAAKLGSTTALFTLIASAPSFADVTAAQVWGDWKAYMEGFGYSVEAQEAQSGNTLTLNDVEMSMDIPDEAGTVTMSMPSFTFTEKGDGSVAIDLPGVMPITFAINSNHGEDIAGAIDYIQNGLVMTVSGDATNMVYDYSAADVQMVMKSLAVDGKPIDFGVAAMVMRDVAGQSNMVLGNLRNITQNATFGALEYDLDIADPEGGEGRFTAKGAIKALTSTSKMTIPMGEYDPSDLPAVLAAGFSVDAALSHGGGQSSFSILDKGDAMQGQSTSGGGSLTINMGADQLAYAGSASDISVSFVGGDIPFPVEMTMAESAFNLGLPVAAGEEPQDFAFGLKMGDFSVSDMIWDMVDPTLLLPRDPATIALDLTGKATMFASLFDAEAMESEATPGQLEGLTIRDIVLRIAGVELTGKGAFTFDNTDTATFDGIPRPEGAVDLKLVGGNGLLFKLVTMGLIPEEQAMGARMMMGLFAVPGEGEDTLNSKIEVNDQGHVLANGQRLK